MLNNIYNYQEKNLFAFSALGGIATVLVGCGCATLGYTGGGAAAAVASVAIPTFAALTLATLKNPHRNDLTNVVIISMTALATLVSFAIKEKQLLASDKSSDAALLAFVGMSSITGAILTMSSILAASNRGTFADKKP